MTPLIPPEFSLHRSAMAPQVRAYWASSSAFPITILPIRQALRLSALNAGESSPTPSPLPCTVASFTTIDAFSP